MTATTSRPAIDSALRADYERDGFVVVRGLFEADEMAAAAAEADRLLVEHAAPEVHEEPRAAAGRTTSSPASVRSRRSTR